jgi:hypothetical protein
MKGEVHCDMQIAMIDEWISGNVAVRERCIYTG